MRFCSVPRCGVVARSGRCRAHAKVQVQHYDRFATGETRYDSGRWRRLREAVLLDHPFCRDCEREGQTYSTANVVDHIVPHRGNVTLMFDVANCQPLCAHHHRLKSAREAWRR